MAHKASIYLLLSVLAASRIQAASSFDASLKEAISSNDWAAQVSLLLPRKGQNFEQDFQLAKALLQNEKRSESLKVLSGLLLSGRDERVPRLMRVASEMFFSQETSNLHFEAVRLLSVGKHPEARERLEQANAREAGNVLVLTRLIQCEILAGAMDPALAHLKEALTYLPPSAELKGFSMKIALMEEAGKPGDTKGLVQPKRPYPSAQVPFVFMLETLKRLGREEDLRSILEGLPKQHPKWSHAMAWACASGSLPDSLKLKFKQHLKRELESRERFEKELAREMADTQHFWIGHISYEELVKNTR